MLFQTLQQNQFNHHHVHGTLGYLSPVEFRKRALKKQSEFVLTIHTSINTIKRTFILLQLEKSIEQLVQEIQQETDDRTEYV